MVGICPNEDVPASVGRSASMYWLPSRPSLLIGTTCSELLEKGGNKTAKLIQPHTINNMVKEINQWDNFENVNFTTGNIFGEESR